MKQPKPSRQRPRATPLLHRRNAPKSRLVDAITAESADRPFQVQISSPVRASRARTELSTPTTMIRLLLMVGAVLWQHSQTPVVDVTRQVNDGVSGSVMISTVASALDANDRSPLSHTEVAELSFDWNELLATVSPWRHPASELPTGLGPQWTRHLRAESTEPCCTTVLEQCCCSRTG